MYRDVNIQGIMILAPEPLVREGSQGASNKKQKKKSFKEMGRWSTETALAQEENRLFYKLSIFSIRLA